MELPFQQIEWNERMATGNARIDRQHHVLIDMLREANARLLDDHSGELLGDIARELLNYAIIHFETEESLMKQYGYWEAWPDVARTHVAQHRDFSHQVVAIHDQLREGRQVSRIDVLRFLNEWLRNHVLGIDQRLGEFLREATKNPAGERDQAG